MAELASYYLLSVGHTAANVTARTLALDTARHPQLLDTLGSWFPVGSEESCDWLSLNRDTFRSLRRLAKTGPAAIGEIAVPATTLLQSPEWQELSRLRGAHYHRRRPQSAGVMGVPLANPWTFGDGVAWMGLGASQYTDGDKLAMSITDLARRLSSVVASTLDDLRGKVTAVVQEMQTQFAQAASAAASKRGPATFLLEPELPPDTATVLFAVPGRTPSLCRSSATAWSRSEAFDRAPFHRGVEQFENVGKESLHKIGRIDERRSVGSGLHSPPFSSAEAVHSG